jgi:sugar O-acyltransferase (sialic acid O-acetyltransferase NeuD family)
MQPIRLPREDVNDETAVLVRWLAEEGAQVQTGQPLCELETTKTIFSVPAPGPGILARQAAEGQELPVGSVLGYLLAEGETPAPPPPEPPSQPPAPVRATRQARELARRYGIDLTSLGGRGIITAQEVEAAAAPRRPSGPPARGVPRVLVLGAGAAAMQILDILLHDPSVAVVGCLDDNPALHQTSLFGVPVLGSLDRLAELRAQEAFDQAIVGVGTNLPVRRNLYLRCRELGIPLANAIDPSARLNRHVVLGQGNVLCSFVHLGVGAVLGDNCFLAAHTSVDHHCRLGDHVVLGPGCLLSGTVTVGDEVLFGSGVVVQPTLTIGSRCRIASGAVILRDIPEGHAVKLRPATEVTTVKLGG